METNTRPRMVLATFVALSLTGCVVSGTDLRSIPTLEPEAPVVHACQQKSGIFYSPAGGAELCFSIHGVEVEAEAMNEAPIAAAVGFLVPIPYLPKKGARSDPLEI